MIKEELVSFETAKLAKEKKFDIPCNRAWSDKDSRNEEYERFYSFNNDEKVKDHFRFPLYSAPTQSLLQKWLWETHGFWVEMTLWGDGMGFVCLIKQAKGGEADGSTIVRQVGIVENGFEKDPYKILEKGIQTALKLIE